MTLGEDGRCCGKKVRLYKRGMVRFCARCKRCYAMSKPHQVESWAWIWDRKSSDFIPSESEEDKNEIH